MAERRPIVVRPGEGERLWVAGDEYRFLATASDTDSRFAIWHATVFPGGGPPPHVHSREEEAFFLLSGRLTFVADGESFVATQGDFVSIPVGCEHRFTNDTEENATCLILVAPGGMEAMFRQVGVPAGEPGQRAPRLSQREIESLLEIAPRYGIEVRAPGH